MVGERIRELREQNGYTQSELAKKLHLSRSAVNAWEMGTSVPSTQFLVELSNLFNTSTDYILGINKDESVDISYLTNSEKEMIYAMMNHFRKYHFALDTLHDGGYVHPDENYEELYKSGMTVPKCLEGTFAKEYGDRKKPSK